MPCRNAVSLVLAQGRAAQLLQCVHFLVKVDQTSVRSDYHCLRVAVSSRRVHESLTREHVADCVWDDPSYPSLEHGNSDGTGAEGGAGYI